MERDKEGILGRKSMRMKQLTGVGKRGRTGNIYEPWEEKTGGSGNTPCSTLTILWSRTYLHNQGFEADKLRGRLLICSERFAEFEKFSQG
jgi:hypothetical protein